MKLTGRYGEEKAGKPDNQKAGGAGKWVYSW
jgi:hypothetical protein